MMTKPKPPKIDRRIAAKQRLIEAGGRVLLVELSPVATYHLETIKERDAVTNRGAIEQSLELNAKAPKPPRR